jgi:hypothetical protein
MYLYSIFNLNLNPTQVEQHFSYLSRIKTSDGLPLPLDDEKKRKEKKEIKMSKRGKKRAE